MPYEVSIILPSLNRPKQLLKTIDNIKDTTKGIDIEFIVLLSKGDRKSQFAMENREYLTVPDTFSPVECWNFGAKLSSGKWMYLGSDDVIHPPNWLRTSLAVPNKGFIGLSDGRPIFDWALFFLVTKEWCRTYQNGVFLVPHYHCWGVDPEISLRAKRSGTYVMSPILLDHRHYMLGKSKKDKTYTKGEKYHAIDTELFKKRQSLGFPDDFEGFL
jgi:glycosyltransferase involved in cell wall biosynthesis